ncbi:MAG: cation diffusion facilitator family transporter [Bacteriovoracia bacterium]
MGHSHEHSHDHDHGHGHRHAHAPRFSKVGDARAQRALFLALGLTAAFMVVEWVGGWIANSLALMTDAAHMLTDVGALGLSAFVLWLSRRPGSKQMTFGYQRAEILGALANGLLVWLLAGLLIFEAIQRFMDPPAVQGQAVFFIAIGGLIVNLIGMRLLHSSQGHSLNLRGAYLHILGDLLGSVGAIVAGFVLWRTDWRWIDPLVSILFSALVLYSAWRLVRDAVEILMESSPKGIDPARVMADLSAVPTITGVHDLHIWTVSSGKLALSVHLISERNEEALQEAHRILDAKYGIHHTTIQVEHPKRFQSDRCFDCAH